MGNACVLLLQYAATIRIRPGPSTKVPLDFAGPPWTKEMGFALSRERGVLVRVG